MSIKVIAISGYARAGKDTFVGIAKNILIKNGHRAFRIAFADKLKDEVHKMLISNGFKLNLLDVNTEEKDRIRPLYVFWGCQRRYESNEGLYWVNDVDKQLHGVVNDMLRNGEDHQRIVALVSDIRFPNEVKWVHDQWGGVVIHLKKYTTKWMKSGQDGSDETLVRVYDDAPNEEEAKQDPLVQKMADHCIEWESAKKTTSTEAIADPQLQAIVLSALNNTKYFKHPTIGILSQ